MSESDTNTEKRTQFGNRYLTDPDLVFEHNAWDNVEWDDEMEQEALTKISTNSSVKLSEEEQETFDKDANKFWDAFYSQHQNRFFKDRHWLFTEFPELAKKKEDQSKVTIFEVGCGVGNTIFPLLETNNNPNLFVYGCDLSETAIQIVKESAQFEEKRCHAFVADVSDPLVEFPFPEKSLDFISLIFVLSAIKPEKMQNVITKLSKHLKPGGMVLFRDYGRYDMAQLRFKKGRCLEDNFYVRGDGTRVYFFLQDDLKQMFERAGFVEEENYVDRRLQVNRGRQLKMFRVWIQCKYRLPHQES